jgi:hypothetical protein
MPEHAGSFAGGIRLLLQLVAISQFPFPVNVYSGGITFITSILLVAEIGVEQLEMFVITHLIVSLFSKVEVL